MQQIYKIMTVGFIALLLNSCSLIPQKNEKNDTHKRSIIAPNNSEVVLLGYHPIEPIFVEKFEVKSRDKKEDIYWKELKNSEIREALPLQSASVIMIDENKKGGANYLLASVSSKRGNYTVIMDYVKYRTEQIYSSGGTFLGNAKVGIGLRIKAKVKTIKENLNLGSLMALGLEAQRNNLRGEISIDVIGIDSENVTNLIPLTSQIDQSSIQNALQALASIKSKIYEEESILTPHIVAINPSTKDNVKRVVERIKLR